MVEISGKEENLIFDVKESKGKSLLNIFVYGSLMYETVWSRVVTGSYAAFPARLEDWRRLAVKGEDYPAAVPGPGIIEGILRIGVSEADVRRLDLFEGEEYIRVTCFPVWGTPGKIEAAMYRFNDEFRHRLMREEWDRIAFEKSGLNRFLNRYRGFGPLDDNTF